MPPRVDVATVCASSPALHRARAPRASFSAPPPAPTPRSVAANAPAFTKLARFSVGMFAAALAAFFFFSSEAVASRLPGGASRGARDAYGAAAAVVATNAVIVAFVWSAFSEPDEDPAGEGAGESAAEDARGARRAARRKAE